MIHSNVDSFELICRKLIPIIFFKRDPGAVFSCKIGPAWPFKDKYKRPECFTLKRF